MAGSFPSPNGSPPPAAVSVEENSGERNTRPKSLTSQLALSPKKTWSGTTSDSTHLQL